MTPETIALRRRYLAAFRALHPNARQPLLSGGYGWWTFRFPRTLAVERRVRTTVLLRELAAFEALLVERQVAA